MTIRTYWGAIAALSLVLAACGNNDSGGDPAPTSFVLTVATVGGGTVNSSPSGITCGTDCTQSYNSGTSVTLTATPDAGKVFASWSGACSGVAACVVTMNANLSVTATFADPPPVTVSEVIALTADNRIISFAEAAPETLTSNLAVTGLETGEVLVGIDVRPSNSLLYALGSSGRLYVIDPATGAVDATQTKVLAPASGDPFTALDGTSFGVDFNPVADRLRVVSNTGQNLRINPADGTVITDTALTVGGMSADLVTGAAYSNNFAGATGTLLYVIRTGDDTLYLQNPANDGTLSAIGGLGVDATEFNGFDISGSNFEGLAILKVSGATVARLYSVNLGTGAATTLGAVGTNEEIVGMTRKTIVTGTPPTGDVFALAAPNQLLNFNRATPGTIISRAAIAGLPQGETLIGIDFRPTDGLLYSVSATGRVYTINTSNGLATEVALLAGSGFAGLQGTSFGFDVNTVNDSARSPSPSLRIVSNTGQNLVVDLAATVGAVNVQQRLNRGVNNEGELIAANATAVAYSNAFRYAQGTTLYAIDTANDVLATVETGGAVCQNNGSNCNPLLAQQGEMTNVGGGLGVDADGTNGFEIDGYTGQAFAALSVAGEVGLYRVYVAASGSNNAGTVERIGAIGGGTESIRGIALRLPSTPVVYAVTTGNMLISFAPPTPETLLSEVAITGLGAGEEMVGIDFRASDRKLFGLTSNGKVYELTPQGAATLVSTMVGSPDDPTDPFMGFDQTFAFGLDFNPTQASTVASLRITAENATNVRTVVPTGETFTDDDFSGPFPGTPDPCDQRAAGSIVAGAYTNNIVGSTSTALYVIDSASACLYTANITDSVGSMTTVGPLFGQPATDSIGPAAGFDIVGGTNGLALGALTDDAADTQSDLYYVNLGTNLTSARTSPIQSIGSATTGAVRGLTIVFMPVP